MLGVAANRAENLAVIIMGPPTVDEDWLAYVRAIDELHANAGSDARPALIQILKSGIEMPSPRSRRELASLRGRIHPRAVNAVVAEAPFIRMMQTALDWIRKPPYTSSTHADFPSAARWLEQQIGRPVSELMNLKAEAEAAAASPANVAARIR